MSDDAIDEAYERADFLPEDERIPAPPETPHLRGFRRNTFEIGWRNGYRDGRAGKATRPTDAGLLARGTREAEQEGYYRGYLLGRTDGVACEGADR